MENIAHTLFGAALGQTGLKKLSRLGMQTLIISANLPDIDLLWSSYSDTSYIVHHRGFTHSFAGILPQMLILSTLMYLYGKKFKANDASQLSFVYLMVLSLIGLLSHLGLDYLNDYGIRPFFPFNNDMFLAGNIFIIDAWFWLLLGGYVFLSIGLNQFRIILFSIFAILSSLLILLFPLPELTFPLRAIYPLGVLALGLIRFKFGKVENSKFGIFTFSAFFIYLFTTVQLKFMADTQFINNKNSIVKEQIKKYQISPSALNPFKWNFLVSTQDFIYHGMIDSLKPKWFINEKIAKNFSEDYAKKALNTETGKIMQNFSPYIFVYLKKEDNIQYVYLRDGRYIKAGEKSFASIRLKKDDLK